MQLLSRSIVFVLVLLSAVAGAATPVEELFRAIEAKDTAHLQALLDQKYPPDAPAEGGTPPLLQAAQSCQPDIVFALIAAGAKVDAADPDGRTPLMAAAGAGCSAAVEALLEAGANPLARDRSGRDVLGYAMNGNDPRTITGILSEYGVRQQRPRVRGYARTKGEPFVTVPVYYATNRKPVAASGGRVDYSGDLDQEVHYGLCQVSIPDVHVPGELETPSLFRIEFSPDPARHVVLQKAEELGEKEFYRSLKDATGKKELLVFVHGYNVKFAKAARRTAQMAHDLRFDGVPLLISWPSSGSLLGYQDDAAKVEKSIPAIQKILTGVIAQYRPERIHVVAHSMGTYGLSRALVRMSEAAKKGTGPIFNQLILAAPDIDAELFREEIAPRLTRLAGRVSLYGSSNDLAMSVSRRYNRGRRAGDSSPEIVVARGIDSIDVSQIDTSLVGHSYYGSNRSVLTDIKEVLQRRKPHERTFLVPRSASASLASWFFNPFKRGGSP